ncbi:MAG: response regulator [Planctomycetes bacterium]|nr:response regulator [Planctomycetota bacterium]
MDRRNILLIDDEPEVLGALKRICRMLDHEILTATNGREALEIITNNELMLVVSDYHMPGMNGIELLKEARKVSPRTVRMLLTGDRDRSTTIEAVNTGEIYRFASKPWHNEELLAIINQCIEKYNLEEENIRLRKQVEEMIKAETVRQMTVTLSHEINNPLTALGGFIELLIEKDKAKEDMSDLGKTLEVMREAWTKIATIMRKMQDIKEVKTVEYTEGSLMIDAKESK